MNREEVWKSRKPLGNPIIRAVRRCKHLIIWAARWIAWKLLTTFRMKVYIGSMPRHHECPKHGGNCPRAKYFEVRGAWYYCCRCGTYFLITHPHRDLEPKGWRRRAYDLANRK